MKTTTTKPNQRTTLQITIRRACKCESEFQDKQYGKKIRIHTPGNKAYTCTVCGNKIPT